MAIGAWTYANNSNLRVTITVNDAAGQQPKSEHSRRVVEFDHSPRQKPIAVISPPASKAEVTPNPLQASPTTKPPATNTEPTVVVPWRKLAEAELSQVRHMASVKPATIATGSFALSTTMPDLPEVICDWCIPLTDDRSPMPSAVDLVCLFPYPTEKQAIGGIASVLHRHWGFTTLSLRFPGMGSMDGNDRHRFYYYPESGSGAAWVAAIERVRQIGGFPARPVFVTGRSGGGSAAGLFADAYPDRVAAVVNEAGRVFSTTPRFAGPVLLMHGHHDYVAPDVDAYVAQFPRTQLTRITFPPSWSQRGSSQIWHHGINGPAEQALWHWLAGVANMRLAKGVIPPRSTWPARNDLPDDSTADLVAKIANPYQSLTTGSGTGAIARPLGKPRGIIALIGNSFSSDIEETALDAESLANDGWLAIAINGQGRQLAANLRSSFSETAFAGTLHLPWMLVVDEADGIAELLNQRTNLVGIVLRGARSSQARQILTMTNRQRLPLAIIGQVETVATCRRMDWQKPVPIWLSVKCNNRGSWHRESSLAIRAQAKAWMSSLSEK